MTDHLLAVPDEIFVGRGRRASANTINYRGYTGIKHIIHMSGTLQHVPVRQTVVHYSTPLFHTVVHHGMLLCIRIVVHDI